MKTVVFAYHDLGVAGLSALERAGYDVALIFSHADDPRERCWFASVRQWAEARGLPVACPESLCDPAIAARIDAIGPQTIFSFYYRLMIPERILSIPPRGAYNLHGSLLPAYRGRCPVNWVLVHGERETGVTLHHMVRAPDAGDIVGQRRVAIDPDDTALSLYGKLRDAATGLLDELLPLIREGRAPRIPQDHARASYYGGRRPEDGRIDWNWPAARICNLIRAVTEPYPGAFTLLPDGSRLTVWRGREEAAGPGPEAPPGTVRIDADGVSVGTGRGRVALLDLEREEIRMTGEAILRHFAGQEGMKLT